MKICIRYNQTEENMSGYCFDRSLADGLLTLNVEVER